jgi:hypothetical protein
MALSILIVKWTQIKARLVCNLFFLPSYVWFFKTLCVFIENFAETAEYIIHKKKKTSFLYISR